MDTPALIDGAHWVDRAFASRLAGKRVIFRDGWGDESAESSLDRALERRPADPIDLQMEQIGRSYRGDLYEASFSSPAAHLPAPVRRARLRIREPHRRTNQADKRVCIVLPSLGDGSWWVRDFAAAPLLRHGISYALLEAPYYGRRRAAESRAYGLGKVSDQFNFAAGVIEETAAVAGWFRDRGYAVALAGYSMGGSMAGYTLARLPWSPPAVVAAAGACAVTAVFEGLIARQVCWERLGKRGESRVRETFQRFSLGRQPPPLDPTRVHVVGCARDGMVDPRQVEALHQHWCGSTLRWLRTGHIGGAIRFRGALRRGITELLA